MEYNQLMVYQQQTMMVQINKKKFIVNSIAYKNLRNGWKHIYLYARERRATECGVGKILSVQDVTYKENKRK